MRTLPVAHLAAHASRVVKDVQGGDRITITVRGEPVAVMVPAAGFALAGEAEACGPIVAGSILASGPGGKAGRCRGCRFWDVLTNSDGKRGECVEPSLSEALSASGDGWSGGFVFRPLSDFGCIHFEVKDK